jgi:REP element-mobilizing transposase RayT
MFPGFGETSSLVSALHIFMPRMARAVLAGVPHHVTQRGVNRQAVFLTDCDRRVYFELVLEGAQQFGVGLLGYCLMTNHVHWIVVPSASESLTKAFAQAHGRYAHYANALLRRSGHFWQNRFFSCALEGGTSLGGAALCGAQPGARWIGGNRRSVAVVERGGAYGTSGQTRLAGSGRLERPVHGS